MLLLVGWFVGLLVCFCLFVFVCLFLFVCLFVCLFVAGGGGYAGGGGGAGHFQHFVMSRLCRFFSILT